MADLVTESLIQRLNQGKIVASTVGATITGVKAGHVKPYVMELCSAVVKGTLQPSKLAVAVEAAGIKSESTASVLADVFWYYASTLYDMADDHATERAKLAEAAKVAVQSEVAHARMLQERCEVEFLEDAGIMISGDAATYKKKEIKVNTKLLYTQNKFNLLREESEGYSKLVTLFNLIGPDALSEDSAEATIRTVQSLIGYFDLDPNRVFDLLIDSFEQQPTNLAFLKLLPLFRQSNMAHILGFKFQFYGKQEEPTPPGLYQVAAVLISSGSIELAELYPHLTEPDDVMFTRRAEHIATRMAAAKRIGFINLAASADQAQAAKKETPPEVIAMTEEEPTEENQKLHLIAGFLAAGSWDHASALIKRLEKLEPAAFTRVGDALRQHLAKLISTPATASGKQSGAEAMEEGEAAPGSEALHPEAVEVLEALGLWLHRDPILFARACRYLLRHAMAAGCLPEGEAAEGATQAADAARAHLEHCMEKCLLPALTLIPSNPAIVNEVWAVLRLLPYTARFRLYGAWKEALATPASPMLAAQKNLTLMESKKIMRRLSKENVKQFGRMLGKIAHADPLTIFSSILSQIEVYNNMIGPVVDAMKYLTAMGYDVLTYVTIINLGGNEKAKLKEDGMNVSLWLASLASFCGHLTRKYPAVQLTALIQLIANQLKDSQSLDLLVLKEVVARMTGVELLHELSEDQLTAMAGGETLRAEALTFNTIGSAKSLSKGAARLKDALNASADPLLVPILVLIAQLRTAIPFTTDTPHLKLMGMLYDQAHETFCQYVDFLTMAITPIALYAETIPSIPVLSGLYKLEPEMVFQVYRPVLQGLVATAIPSPRSDQATRDKLALEVGPLKVTWAQLLGMVRGMLAESTWASLPVELYLAFWTLSLYDLHCPSEKYESEIARQRKEIQTIDEGRDRLGDDQKRRKERDRLAGVMEKLDGELQRQEKHVGAVHKRLQKESQGWLMDCKGSERSETVVQLLQNCIFPRVMVSYADAVYCARFVHKLHDLGTPYFSTLQYYDRVLRDSCQMLFCCTEYEAARLGRFLQETLSLLAYWKSERAIYDKECKSRPGFCTAFTDPTSKRAEFEEFIKVNFRWHNKITKSLGQCLESSEYMHIRNALIVLNKMVKVFPKIVKHGAHIEKRVTRIRDHDDREDLKLIARGYIIALTLQKKEMVNEDEFHHHLVQVGPPAPAPAPAQPSRAKTSARDENGGKGGGSGGAKGGGKGGDEGGGKAAQESGERGSKAGAADAKPEAHEAAPDSRSAKRHKRSASSDDQGATAVDGGAMDKNGKQGGGSSKPPGLPVHGDVPEGEKERGEKREKKDKDKGDKERKDKDKESKEDKRKAEGADKEKKRDGKDDKPDKERDNTGREKRRRDSADQAAEKDSKEKEGDKKSEERGGAGGGSGDSKRRRMEHPAAQAQDWQEGAPSKPTGFSSRAPPASAQARTTGRSGSNPPPAPRDKSREQFGGGRRLDRR